MFKVETLSFVPPELFQLTSHGARYWSRNPIMPKPHADKNEKEIAQTEKSLTTPKGCSSIPKVCLGLQEPPMKTVEGVSHT